MYILALTSLTSLSDDTKSAVSIHDETKCIQIDRFLDMGKCADGSPRIYEAVGAVYQSPSGGGSESKTIAYFKRNEIESGE